MVDNVPDAACPTLAVAIERVKELKANDKNYPMLPKRDIWIENE
jgi:hypothetical protein